MGPHKVGVPGDRLARAWRPEGTPQSSLALGTGTGGDSSQDPGVLCQHVCTLIRRQDQAHNGLVLKPQLHAPPARPPRSCVHSCHLQVPQDISLSLDLSLALVFILFILSL